MLKQAKQLLMVCLMALQFVAPFIHAHAFGHDSFKEHAFHMHTAETVHASNNVNHAFNQAHISEYEITGAITTVSSGIKNTGSDDITDGLVAFALFFTLAILLFATINYRNRRFSKSLYVKQNYYFLQNPRAPPR